MTTIDDNLNGLELLSGRLITLFLTLANAQEAVKGFPAGTKIKVTNDPNSDLNGEYTWDGQKLVKTTNNILEKAKEHTDETVKNEIEENLTTDKLLELLEGSISGSELDRRLQQRIDKVPLIVTDVDDLKNEVVVIQQDVNVKINTLNQDLINIHNTIDDKFVEVDDIRADLNKEVQDRINAVKAEEDARIEAVKKLDDGLTQEILDREEGDKEVLAYVDTYKKSNDDALAVIREEVVVAVDTANASAQKVDAMDARVTSAENNASTALENSASAVTKVNALATDVNAITERVDSLSTEVVKAVDDSGQALKNSATAIESAKTAVDTANATAEQVTIVQAKLNDKSTTYMQDYAPTKENTPNLTVGDIWINPELGNEQKRWNGTNWEDIADFRIGDNATAITKLTATVTEQGDTIQANTQKITDLETSIGDKVSSSAFESLTNTVTQQGDSIKTNTESITALQSTVSGKADAKALDDLQIVVTQQGEDITSQGKAITSLETSIAGKADASALTALQSEVTEIDGELKSQGQAITALENSIADKADASAVNQLKTTVEEQGNTITSQGQAITKVEARVDNIAVGSENLIDDAGVWGTQIATGGDIASLSSDLSVLYVWSSGQAHYVTGMLPADKIERVDELCNTDDDVIFSVEMLIEHGSEPKAPLLYWKDPMAYVPLELAKGQVQRFDVWQRYYHVRKYVKGGNNPHFSFPSKGVYRFRRPIFERGNIPTAWNVSDTDFATAKAVQTLDAKVTTIGDKTDANAQAITDLRTSVNGKADSSALESLKSTVTEQGNTITSQGQAITSVTAQAGQTANQVGNTKNYNLTTIRNGFDPNGHYGLFNAKNEKLGTLGRGLNVYVFDGYGDHVNTKHYDTYGVDTGEASYQIYVDMKNFLDSLAYGTFIAIVGADHIGSFSYNNASQVVDVRSVLKSQWGLGDDYLVNWYGNNLPIVMTKKGAPPYSSVNALFTSEVGNDVWSKVFTFINGVPSEYGGSFEQRSISANATAVTKLDATVTRHDDEIKANAQAVTGLQSKIDGKADANALNELKTTVEQQGDAITSQGTAITQVEAKADLALDGITTVVDMTSHDQNLYYPVYIPLNSNNFAEIAINMPLGREQAPWSSHNSGSFSLNVAWREKGSGWGANDAERQIVNFGYLWTQSGQSPAMEINQDITTSTGYIYLRGGTRYHITTNKWAGTPYVQPPNSGMGVGYDQSKVPQSINNKLNATATATTNLESTVNIVNGKVDANSQAITQVGTTVGNSSINILQDSNIVAEKPVGQNPYPFWSRGMSKKLVWNKQYTLVFEAEFTTGGGNSMFAPYVHGNQQLWATSLSFGRQVHVLKFTQTSFDTGADGAINFYIIGGQPDQNNSYAKVYWACLYEGDLAEPPRTWQPNTFENNALVQQSLQSINGIKAQYTVKTDVNGYVAGIGLINEGSGKSQFIIRADEFAIANPASVNNEAKYAFVYRSSPKTLPNGTVIPAGLYVDNLMLAEVNAEKINATSISAISANLGRFESSVAGAGKTVIQGQSIEIYDVNNQLRVFLGVKV